MRTIEAALFGFLAFATVSFVGAQNNPKPENATAAVLRAFETHNIVMIGEIHSNKQEYDWFRSLVATPNLRTELTTSFWKWATHCINNRSINM